MKSLTLVVMATMLAGCAQTTLKRSGTVTLKGKPLAIMGSRVTTGRMAPDFTALDANFKPVSLWQFKGKTVLISAVPSLDTPVCSMQTKRFNDALKSFQNDVVVITISMDLPVAQKRFCTAEKIAGMQVLSDSARREFGARYGVWIADRGLLARSVFVVDKNGRLRYKEIVTELTSQPNYDAVLGAVTRIASE